jgi:hypothetical protein
MITAHGPFTPIDLRRDKRARFDDQQAQGFFTQAYNETQPCASRLRVSYAAQTATIRSEL